MGFLSCMPTQCFIQQPKGLGLSAVMKLQENRTESFLIIPLNHVSQSEMKDNNDFIESSLPIRDVSNIAPAEIQIRGLAFLSSLQMWQSETTVITQPDFQNKNYPLLIPIPMTPTQNFIH